MAAKQHMEKGMSGIKRKIIITEAQFRRLIETDENSEYLADDFHADVKKFVKDLLSSPANAEIPERLKDRDINRNKLIDALIEKGFLTRKQTVKEVEKDGKRVSRMMTIYSANLDNGTQKIEEVRKALLESKDNEVVMDEEALFEIETDEVDEAMAAGASNGAGGTWMGDASYTAPVKLGGKKDPAYDHTDIVRKSFNAYSPKTKKIDESVEEASNRSQYWKDRWAKQKAEGTVPDRSEYWKERAKKQKQQKPKRKINRNYHDYIERLRDEDKAMDMMSDNDWGEYFGDHD